MPNGLDSIDRRGVKTKGKRTDMGDRGLEPLTPSMSHARIFFLAPDPVLLSLDISAPFN